MRGFQNFNFGGALCREKYVIAGNLAADLISEPLAPLQTRLAFSSQLFHTCPMRNKRRILLVTLLIAVLGLVSWLFLRPDAELAVRGLRYNPRSLLACDVEMARYFTWLAGAAGAARAALADADWTEG